MQRLMTQQVRRNSGYARRGLGVGLALVGSSFSFSALAQSTPAAAGASTVGATVASQPASPSASTAQQSGFVATPAKAAPAASPTPAAPGTPASGTPASGTAASGTAAAPTAPTTTHVEAPELAQGATVPQTAVPQTDAQRAAVSRRAPAVKPPPLDAADFEATEEWYGWQNLIVDGAVVGQLALAAATNTDELSGMALVTYLVGSPIVHWAHGNVGTGFGSLGIRVAALGTLVVGTAVCVSDALSGDSSDGLCAVAVVGLLALPAAIAVDAAVFAYDDVEPEKTSTTHLLPWVSHERKAAGVNWVGRF